MSFTDSFPLYFTEEEAIKFLHEHKFTTEKVTVWEPKPWPLSNEHFVYETTIAYFFKGKRPDELIEKGNAFDLISKFGVEKIFRKELHKALLKL